jgi:AcrR family transcriptional regulator
MDISERKQYLWGIVLIAVGMPVGPAEITAASHVGRIGPVAGKWADTPLATQLIEMRWTRYGKDRVYVKTADDDSTRRIVRVTEIGSSPREATGHLRDGDRWPSVSIVMSERTQSSRRVPSQARAAETRRRLLDAGFAAFAAKGHDGVNLVDDVLEPAGISIGSFYHQFADKTELLREILAEAAGRRRAFIAGLGELGAATRLADAVTTMFDRLYESLETDAEAWQLQRMSRISGISGVRELTTSNRDQWSETLARLLDTWFASPLASRVRAADVMVTFARGLLSDFLDTPLAMRRHRADLVTSATDFALGGLTAMLGPTRV